MTGFPFDIVGFDLDGTLFDTSADLAAALNHALVGLGRTPLAVEAVKPMIGRGGRHMLQRGLEATGGFDPEALDPIYDEMIAFYEANIARHTRPFSGLIEALDALAARGVKLAIVTNKQERLAVKLVGELGLAERFDAVIGGDTLGPGMLKPSPALLHEMARRCGGGRAAFVGDSIFDVQAAKAAGMPVVAVSFGFPLQGVDTLAADAVIDDYSQLVPALEQLRTE
ncbi:MAG: HAD-IA family hydrolase [Sphingomonas sp.]|uniref:HAD-IA family hydrolase n=1 Tax=Sphingomonas sp. TaxID=28214 RepID=UPI001B1A2FE3|nr:HAD-IA family hydrolase [Sphingomonas sp.]MBO9622500.1 HAD-IA family hydrolase [Sphingomonas sp.]